MTETKTKPRTDLFMTPQGDGRYLLWMGTQEHAVARHVDAIVAAELCRLWNGAHAAKRAAFTASEGRSDG